MDMMKKTSGIKEIALGRKDVYRVDPRDLNVEDGFNARIDYSGGEELREFIRHNGVPGVYRIYTKNNKLFIKDGHRRQREVLALINEGLEIRSVDCIHEKESEEERVFGLLSMNEGKPFRPVEQGDIYLRLIKFGWTQSEIAEKTGKSQSHVSNCINLARTPRKVRDLMAQNVVPDTTVLHALAALNNDPNATDEMLIEIIQKSAEEAKESGEGSRGASRRVKERIGKTTITPSARVKQLGQFVEENQIVMKDNRGYNAVVHAFRFMKGEITIDELLKEIQ